MWERADCGFTTPHDVDEGWNELRERYLLSTDDAHQSELTRRNIGTCAVLGGPYIVPTRLGGKGWDLAFQQRLQTESERKFRGGRRCNQGLRRSLIREQLAGSDSWGQSRCPSHVELVPRRAVRKVGPRPDLTRSTHIGEPSDPTGLLGDGSRSLCLPYRGRNSP